MHILKESFKNLNLLLLCLVLFFIAILPWLPMLFTTFLSDDYQILYWHKVENLASAFRHFTSPYILHPYWRPLGSLSFSLTWLGAGPSPFWFHAGSLIFFGMSTVMAFLLGKEIGLSRLSAFIAAIFFGVLPSRELPAGWLSCRGDTMAALFLMTAGWIFFKALHHPEKRKLYFIFSGISYFLAILSKEVAFAGWAIPVIFLLKFYNKPEAFKRYNPIAIISTILAAGIVGITLLYRIIILGGSPFTATHFSQTNPMMWVANFFLYIPLSFVSPDVLEKMAYSAQNSLVIAVIYLIIFVALAWMLFKTWRQADSTTRAIVYTGLGWFIIFTLPAVPTLMRWYSFTASAGLLWAIAALLENSLRHRKNLLRPFWVSLTAVLLWCCTIDFSIAQNWYHSGNILLKGLKSLEQFRLESHRKITVWCAPDKIDRVLLLKIGLQQSIQWGLQDFRPDSSYFSDTTDVISPLRVEGTSGYSVSMRRASADTVIFKSRGARFLPEGARSSSIFKNEYFFKSTASVTKITNIVHNGNITSEAKVWVPGIQPGDLHIFFDGEIFKRVE